MQVRRSWAAAVLAAGFAGGAAFAAPPDASEPPAKLLAGFGQLPLHFEPNQGQTDARVKFTSRGPGYALYLTGEETVLVSGAGDARSVLRTRLVGARSTVTEGLDRLPGISNYIRPDHRTSVPQYRRVEQAGVYPGIDLVYYGNQRQLEYDFVVAPGADPRAIRLRIAGAEKLEIDGQGNLVMKTRAGRVLQKAPVVFHQDANGERRPVDGRFVLRGKDEVGFEVKKYDRSRPLTIDPVFAIQNYATYLGGSSTELINSIAVDQSGNAYVAGFTQSNDFPTTNGSFVQGPADGFVAKIAADGQSLVYSTYVGGSSFDSFNSIAVDNSGQAFVTGSGGYDFPAGALAGDPHGPAPDDVVVARFDPTGGLAYSGFLGLGDYATGWGIAQRGGQTWVVGEIDGGVPAVVTRGKGKRGHSRPPQTRAARIKDRAGRAPKAPGFGYDAVVAQVDTFTGSPSVVWSQVIGQPGTVEAAYGVSADPASGIYVAGETDGTDIPSALGFANAGAQPTNSGGTDGFVWKFGDNGSRDWMTYLGGSGFDLLNAVDADASGHVYVAGVTDSADFPTAVVPKIGATGGFPNVPIQSTPGGGLDATAGRLSSNLDVLQWSTYLGGSAADFAWGVRALPGSYPAQYAGAYVVGESDSDDFPAKNPLQDCSNDPITDAFIARINDRGDYLSRSTCIGGSGPDAAFGVAVDPAGTAFFAGPTSSFDFPTHDSAIQPGGFGGFGADGFVKRLPFVTVVSPNSYPYDNFWARGGRRPFRLLHSLSPGFDTVDFSISTDGGAFNSSVVPTTQSGLAVVPALSVPLASAPEQIIPIDVPLQVPTGPQNIRVEMSGDGGIEVRDENDVIVAGPTFAVVDPMVVPIRPNLDEVLSAGSTYSLRLSHNVGPDQKAHLLLSKTGPAGPFTAIPPAQLAGGNPVSLSAVDEKTSVNWTVPAVACAPTCVVRAVWDQRDAFLDGPGVGSDGPGGGPGDGVFTPAIDFPDPTLSVTPPDQSVHDSPQFTIGGLGVQIGAFWKMDEASGNRVDSSFAAGAGANADNLVPGGTGGVGSVAGKIGSAADFDPTYPSSNTGVLTRAGGAASNDLRCGAAGLTWAGWVRFDPITSTTPADVIVVDKATEYGVRYKKTEDELRFLIRGGSTAGLRVLTNTPPGTVADGNFHLVVAWWDPQPAPNGSLHIELDNNSATAGSVNATQACPTTLTNPFRIGSSGGGGFFKGSIDAVGVWQRVLTPAERTDLWNGGAGRQLF